MEWLLKILGGVSKATLDAETNSHTQLQLHVEDTRKSVVSQLTALEFDKTQLQEAKSGLESEIAKLKAEHSFFIERAATVERENSARIKTASDSAAKALAEVTNLLDASRLSQNALTVKLNNTENLLKEATQKVSEGLIQRTEQNAVLASSKQAVLLLRDEKANLAKLLEQKETEVTDYAAKTLDLYDTVRTLESALTLVKAEVSRAKEEGLKTPAIDVEAIRTEAYAKAVAELRAIADRGNQTVDSVSKQRDAAVADRNRSREALSVATKERDAAVRSLEETHGMLSDVIKNLTRERDAAISRAEYLNQQLRLRMPDTVIPSATPVEPPKSVIVENVASAFEVPTKPAKISTRSSGRDRSKKKTVVIEAAPEIAPDVVPDVIPQWMQDLVAEAKTETETAAPEKKSKSKSKTVVEKKPVPTKAAPVKTVPPEDSEGSADSTKTTTAAKRSHKKKGT